MSNLKLPTMDYETLLALAPVDGSRKQIGYKTYVYRTLDKAIGAIPHVNVVHHNTIIATIGPHEVTITNGGYVSSTTTARLHRILCDCKTNRKVAIRNFEQAILYWNGEIEGPLTGYRNFATNMA